MTKRPMTPSEEFRAAIEAAIRDAEIAAREARQAVINAERICDNAEEMWDLVETAERNGARVIWGSRDGNA